MRRYTYCTVHNPGPQTDNQTGKEDNQTGWKSYIDRQASKETQERHTESDKQGDTQRERQTGTQSHADRQATRQTSGQTSKRESHKIKVPHVCPLRDTSNTAPNRITRQK